MAQLVREIMIKATPETIWPFLTEPDSLVGWHGTVAEIDPRPGGIYRVLVAGQFQSAGEYVEVVPMEKVVFTFGWDEDDHPIPPGSTTIEITLHPEGDKTACASCTRACRPTRSMTTAVVGRITSNGSRYASRAATRDPTAGPLAKHDGHSYDVPLNAHDERRHARMSRHRRQGHPISRNDDKEKSND